MLDKVFNVNILKTTFFPFLTIIYTSFSILFFAPNYSLVFIAVCTPFFLIFIWDKPFLFLLIFILILPFSNTNLISVQIMGVPGFKIINVIALLTLLSFVHNKNAINSSYYERVFIAGLISLLFIAVFRSVPQLDIINFTLHENFTKIRYFQSHFLKPLIFFSSFIFISFYVSSIKRLESLLKSFIFSIMILSIFLLLWYVFFTPNKTDFSVIRNSFAGILNLNGNAIATIYIVSLPLMISYFFIKKDALSILSITLALIVIGLLYSRTAYGLALLTVIMYLFISKRFKQAPAVAIIMLIAVNFLPDSITQRALTGIGSNDMYQFSAGRVSTIWIPLSQEIIKSPEKILIGSGRFAMTFSESYRNKKVFQATQAHNIYLNTWLEIGGLGVAFFMLFCIYYLKNILITIKEKLYGRNESEYEIIIGVVVSVLCFLIAGITGREAFPTIYNYPLWFVLAMGSTILKLKTKKGI